MADGVVTRLPPVGAEVFFNHIVNHNELGEDAVVSATITELNNGNAHLGSANMSVLNVVPRSGSCVVRVHIDWPSDLNFRVSLLFHNP